MTIFSKTQFAKLATTLVSGLRAKAGRTQVAGSVAASIALCFSAQVANAAAGDTGAVAVRAAATTSQLKPNQQAIGGPFEAVSSTEAAADIAADAQFRNLFMTWKKLDTLEQAVIAIPSMHPVEQMTFTSNYGVRSDPFRGVAAMHAGVDISGPVGTPIYATADGFVLRAERSGGYGNLVELDHGKGIGTRYGHLSKILVSPYERVRRGQLIALMGSTGRSTGSHLHYEVRMDGHAVNPVPFLQTADYMKSAQNRGVQMTAISAQAPAAAQ